MFKIVIYIPEDYLEAVKQAAFAAGAGRLGDYDHCSWQVKGQGQFRSLAGSKPFIGQQGVLSLVDEYRVEMVSEEHCLNRVISAIKQAHPYQMAAIDVWRLHTL